MKSQPHPLHITLCCLAIAAERLAWYATLDTLRGVWSGWRRTQRGFHSTVF